MTAPVLISVYSRLEHLKRCVDSLKTNRLAEDTDLFVVSDAPYAPQHAEIVAEVRRYVVSITGFRSVNLIAWESNKGSVKSIMDARKQIFERYDSLIFMEDDNVVSPYFLDYINEGLERYQSHPEVYCICGFNHNIPTPIGYDADAYFMYSFSAYGYGVWKDRYETFYREYKNPDLKSREYKAYFKELNLPAFYLKRAIRHNWIWGDARLTYYLYHKKMVILFPCKSLVWNTGFDGSGEHCGDKAIGQQGIENSSPVEAFPSSTTIDERWLRAMQKHFRYPFWRRVKTLLYDWKQSHK